MTSWRNLLPDADAGVPLALGVELRQRDAYDPARWEPRAVAAVTPRALARRQDELSVAVRPLVRGARDGWIKGDVTWDTIRRLPQRYRPAHARWFGELYAIASTVRAAGPFAGTADWLTFDDGTSRHVWAHLTEAAALGIPLVPTHPQQSVRLAAADVGVEVAPLSGGALELRARLRIDEAEWDATTARAIGDHGLFAYALHRDPIPLVLAPVAMTGPVPSILGRSGIRVPAEDSAAFLRELYPLLARHTVVTAVGGLPLPALSRPALRIAVAFRPGHTVSYTLSWSYVGAAPIPFGETGGAGRDLTSERSIADAVRRA